MEGIDPCLLHLLSARGTSPPIYIPIFPVTMMNHCGSTSCARSCTSNALWPRSRRSSPGHGDDTARRCDTFLHFARLCKPDVSRAWAHVNPATLYRIPNLLRTLFAVLYNNAQKERNCAIRIYSAALYKECCTREKRRVLRLKRNG